MSSSWLKHRRKSNSTLKRRSASLPRPAKKPPGSPPGASNPGDTSYSSDNGTMLRIFNMRNPTNLTGRFPSTVALHAKVEDLVGASDQGTPGGQGPTGTPNVSPKNEGQETPGVANQVNQSSDASMVPTLPNLVQPLSLLPDWR